MSRYLLNRRQFSAGCAAFGLTLPAILARPAAALGDTAVPEHPVRTVKLPDGTTVTALGQGCWHLGQNRHPANVEEDALKSGISLGMTLLDTSGNYGHGASEEFLSRVLAGERERIFLVSKVEGDEISGDGIAKACDASLRRLKTDYLDLYLLHWPVASGEFPGVVAGFEKLRAAGKIRRWGVSNFDTGQMEDLFKVPNGQHCATNQVPYSLNNRHIEGDLLPWCRQHNMPVMAYSPLGGDKHLVLSDQALADIGAKHGCPPAAVALAWVIRGGEVIAIPESGSPEHVRENAQALSLKLTAEDLEALNKAYPGPAGHAHS